MNSKTKLLIIIIDFLFLVFLILFNVIPQKIHLLKYDKYNEQVLSELIYDGVTINQNFVAKYNANSFSLKIGTFRHFYKEGIIKVEIIDLTNNIKKTFKVNCFSLDDREETIINYPLKKKHNYTLNISTNGINEKNGFIFYSAKYKNVNNYRLLINGEEKKYNMIIGYSKSSYSKSNFWVIILYVSVNFSIFSLFIKEKKQYEK